MSFDRWLLIFLRTRVRPLESGFDQDLIIGRTEDLVRRSQALLAASRETRSRAEATLAEWSIHFGKEIDDEFCGDGLSEEERTRALTVLRHYFNSLQQHQRTLISAKEKLSAARSGAAVTIETGRDNSDPSGEYREPSTLVLDLMLPASIGPTSIDGLLELHATRWLPRHGPKWAAIVFYVQAIGLILQTYRSMIAKGALAVMGALGWTKIVALIRKP